MQSRWHSGKWLVALVIAGLMGSVASANDAADAMNEIYERSSLGPQIELYAVQIDEFVDAQEGLDPASLDSIRTVIAREYRPARVEAEVKRRLEEHYDAARAAEALAWLRSPRGVEMVSLDREAATMSGAVAIELYVDELRQQPPAPERAKLADRMVRAAQLDELRTDLGLAMIETLVLAVDAAQPPETRMGTLAVKEELADARAEALADTRELARAGVLYTYRSLPAAKIEGVVEFAESGAGHWYYGSLRAAVRDALEAVGREANEAIHERLDAASPPAPPGG